jgi:hypothetical protein
MEINMNTLTMIAFAVLCGVPLVAFVFALMRISSAMSLTDEEAMREAGVMPDVPTSVPPKDVP